jgi:hypothetical protein
LRSRLAQADITLNHLDDVSLLLYGLGEVGHGVFIENKARASMRMWKRWKAGQNPPLRVGFATTGSEQQRALPTGSALCA